jgi:hypothetical protein
MSTKCFVTYTSRFEGERGTYQRCFRKMNIFCLSLRTKSFLEKQMYAGQSQAYIDWLDGHLEEGRAIEPSKSLLKDLQFPVTMDNEINDPDNRESIYYWLPEIIDQTISCSLVWGAKIDKKNLYQTWATFEFVLIAVAKFRALQG